MVIARFEARFESLIIGERFKRTIYRPCLETIPSTTVAGFFRENFGLTNVVGVGKVIKETFERRRIVGSLFDRALKGVSLPIETEFLAPRNGTVRCELYVKWDDSLDLLKTIRDVSVAMGAWRYEGFGRGALSFLEIVEPRIKPIMLATRLTETAAEALGVHVRSAVYGYLFESTGPATGHWVRSLFEGSIIEGPDFLGEAYQYDL